MSNTSPGNIFLVEIFARHDFDRMVYQEAAVTYAVALEVGESALADFQADDPDWAYSYELEITKVKFNTAS